MINEIFIHDVTHIAVEKIKGANWNWTKLTFHLKDGKTIEVNAWPVPTAGGSLAIPAPLVSFQQEA